MPVEVAAFQSALLDWYDVHARALPWRAPPGAPRADPYRVWLSEVMLQQTTVAAVIPYFERFTARWPTVKALAAADDGDLMQAWAGLGYYARARNLLACARAVVALGGFPRKEVGLRTLPGVGAYTAAAIASIAFGEAAVVVDGNIERVMTRLFAVATPISAARPELRAHAAELTPTHRPGDHAQALMDLGATVCTPRAPKCLICPVSHWCEGRASGAPEAFPVRAAKAQRPIRYGIVWWIETGGEVLLVRRPPRGLLGGMLALPSSDWTVGTETPVPPLTAEWRDAGIVTHVFTHFELRLAVRTATLPARPAVDGSWHQVADIAAAGLPTLFAKAASVAVGRNVLRHRRG